MRGGQRGSRGGPIANRCDCGRPPQAGQALESHVDLDDPAFKTKEGLGAESALTAFERAYGPASRGEGEGGWYLNFGTGKNAEFQVRVGKACFDEQSRPKRDSKCIVKEFLL